MRGRVSEMASNPTTGKRLAEMSLMLPRPTPPGGNDGSARQVVDAYIPIDDARAAARRCAFTSIAVIP